MQMIRTLTASGFRCSMSIVTYDEELAEVFVPRAVTLTPEDEIDISRGDMIVKTDNIPEVVLL